MAGIFDEDVGGVPLPQAAPIPADTARVIVATPPVKPPQGTIFDEDVGGAPTQPPVAANGVDWSKFNQPFGELKADTPSFTERARRAAQDVILGTGQALGGKPDPYMARDVADALVTGAGFTPMGAILSAGDAIHDFGGGHYIRGAIDTIGAIPGIGQVRRLVQSARGELPITRMADTPTRTINPVTGKPDDELIKSARGHYDAVARAPIDFHPGAMPNFTDAARSALQQPQFGAFTPEAAQGVHDLLARWKSDFSGNRISTPHDFDVLRQQLRAFNDGPDSAAGQRAADFVDQFLSHPPPGAVLRAAPGALDFVRESLANARGDYRAGKTGETVEYAIDRAGTKTGGAHSGLNLDNTTRQALINLANPPVGGADKIFGATYLEKQALNAVGAGDWLTNKARYLGNRMGGGGGIGGSAMGGIAGHTVNSLLGSWGIDPVTATGAGIIAGYTWPKVGESFRGIANERTVKAAEDAVDMIRRNSPLYRAREAAAPPIVDPKAMMRDAVAYAMIPQAVKGTQSVWDTAHVPYANRDQQSGRNLEPTAFGGYSVPPRMITHPSVRQPLVYAPPESYDPSLEQ